MGKSDSGVIVGVAQSTWEGRKATSKHGQVGAAAKLIETKNGTSKEIHPKIRNTSAKKGRSTAQAVSARDPQQTIRNPSVTLNDSTNEKKENKKSVVKASCVDCSILGSDSLIEIDWSDCCRAFLGGHESTLFCWEEKTNYTSQINSQTRGVQSAVR